MKNCDVSVCILRCFEEYHTRARLSYMARVLTLDLHKADRKKEYAHCILTFLNYYLPLCAHLC
jgi:hypothetical protein